MDIVGISSGLDAIIGYKSLGFKAGLQGIPLYDYKAQRFIFRFSSRAAATVAVRGAMGATLTDTIKWVGGVLGPDGKIYGIPTNATDILIIDPVAGTATRSAMGATLTDTAKWRGGVLGPDGKIYGIPYNATDILKINTAVSLPDRVTMSANLNKY